MKIVFEPAGEQVYVWLSSDDVRRTIHMPTTVPAVVDENAGISETGLAQRLSDRAGGRKSGEVSAELGARP